MVAICTAVLEKSNSKVKRCLIFEGKIGKVKAVKSLIFFYQIKYSDIFYNCDESFCAWLTEIVHSSNFQKAAIYARNFQGSLDTTLKGNKFVKRSYVSWKKVWTEGNPVNKFVRPVCLFWVTLFGFEVQGLQLWS